MNKQLKTIVTIAVLILALLGSFFVPSLFETETYTITYVSPYGEQIQPKTFEETIDLELPTMNYEGYTFLGWYEGDTLVSDGTYDRSMTLVARFSQNTYDLVFEEEAYQTMSIIYGQEVFLPISTKEGYLFLGWYEDEALTIPFDETTYEDKTLYPKYEELGINTFAHYYISEFDGLVSEDIVSRDASLSLPNTSKDGYNFLGWQLSGSNTFVSETDVINENAVFLAVFEPIVKTYTISFETGDADPIEPVTLEEGTLFELPNDPELYGYQFKGWVTDIVFDGFNLSSSLVTEDFVVSKDVTLNANFDYMIPSEHIFYEPFRVSGEILGYTIVDITYTTDEVIDYMILPQTYLGLPVVSITQSAFRSLSYLNEVVIPEGYLNISGNAFRSSSVKTIHLPQSLKVIGNNVFESSMIETVLFHENSELVSIGEDSFNDTQMLLSFDVPKSVRVIGESAFEYSQLESITFEEGSLLTLIDQNALSDTKLTSIDLPASLVEIDRGAFSDTPLTSITFKENIQTIGRDAFESTQIESITILNPQGLINLDRDIFDNTPAMTNAGILEVSGIIFGYDKGLNDAGFDVVIEDHVFTLADDAFNSASITTLTFDTDHLINMYSAFEYAIIASSFTLPTSDNNFGAFYDATLTETFELIVPNGASTYDSMFQSANLSNVSLIVSNQLENANNFLSNVTLDTLTLGADVSRLADSFLANTTLKTLKIDAQMLELERASFNFDVVETFDLVDGIEFVPVSTDPMKNVFNTQSGFETDDLGYVTLANILIDTSDVAGLDLKVPDGITVLNSYSLARNLETIDLNDTKYILDSVFMYQNTSYSNNPTITLDENIVFFSGVMLSDWFDRSIQVNITGLPETTIDLHKEISRFTKIYQNLPFDDDGFKRIGNLIFDYDVDNFGENVIIPEGVTIIGAQTFSSKDIVSIQATSPITYIGGDAFSTNNRLENILTAENHERAYFINFNSMDNGAPTFDVIYDSMHINMNFYDFNLMYDYDNLTVDENGFYIHENIVVKYVGTNKDVVIPEGVVSIYDEAFLNTLVETITLPSTLKSIQAEAFAGMVHLKDIIFDPSLHLLYIGEEVLFGSSLFVDALPTADLTHKDYDYMTFIEYTIED